MTVRGLAGEPGPVNVTEAVFVKTAATPLGRARLAHEADMLELARHPGVVELLDFSDDGAGASLPHHPGGGAHVDRVLNGTAGASRRRCGGGAGPNGGRPS